MMIEDEFFLVTGDFMGWIFYLGVLEMRSQIASLDHDAYVCVHSSHMHTLKNQR